MSRDQTSAVPPDISNHTLGAALADLVNALGRRQGVSWVSAEQATANEAATEAKSTALREIIDGRRQAATPSDAAGRTST